MEDKISTKTKKIIQPLKITLEFPNSKENLIKLIGSSIELGKCYQLPVLFSLNNKYTIFLDFIQNTKEYCLYNVYVAYEFSLVDFSWKEYLFDPMKKPTVISLEIILQIIKDLHSKYEESCNVVSND